MLINDKRRGQVYSISADLSRVPDAFRYRLSSRIRRMDEETMTTAPYQQVASQTKHPEERLRLALESGLQVNALDGLFWLGSSELPQTYSGFARRGCRFSRRMSKCSIH